MLVAFWLLLKTKHMGKPWNNESAEKWWACGRHVRQKELAPKKNYSTALQYRFHPSKQIRVLKCVKSQMNGCIILGCAPCIHLVT
jgi:hypothetical protein